MRTEGDGMNWQVRFGEHYCVGVQRALAIVVGRLEGLRPQTHRDAKLIDEALQYARLVQAWAKEQEPPPKLDRPAKTYRTLGVGAAGLKPRSDD